MKRNVYFFSDKEYVTKEEILNKIGIRGRRAMELAELQLPILPGFLIDAEIASDLAEATIKSHLQGFFKKLEAGTGKRFGNPNNPMLVKIVISPSLVITHYPTLHNYGLTDSTLPGFVKFVGENFGHHEVQFLCKGTLEIEARIAELEDKEKYAQRIRQAADKLDKQLSSKMSARERDASVKEILPLLPEGFFSGDAYDQLEIAIQRISHMLSLDEMNNRDTALLIQPMVYGNYGRDSASGNFYTRNIVTGDKMLQGEFYQSAFDSIGATGRDINSIEKKYLSELEKIGRIVEDHFKEIRSIRFTIENKKLWLIDQRAVMIKSTQSEIQTLLDLYNRKVVDDRYAVATVKPQQLNEILHPVINPASVAKMKALEGGIAGAPGAAIGRVFFTTEGLLDAYKDAQLKGADTRLILCMPATFAEDVKAIEVATGVLSNEGGYSAHASVVARQYGKVSLVKPDMRIRGKKATVDSVTISEGDYLTLNVPYYGDPAVYLGTAELIEPDPEDSGLLEFNKLVQKYVDTEAFHVRANADTPRDAGLAKSFGAAGIGLCRTEHMFFHEKRINIFREMILSDTLEERKAALKKLQGFQKSDFYGILKAMSPYEVTIRLLDAPLHEFLPHNDEEMKKFIDHLRSNGGKAIAEREVRARCDALAEFNPMLGHRGCRIAVSYPEIYEMQIRALFEAVYQLQKERIPVHPEIMIPIIMNESELKLLIYGKKIEGGSIRGLVDIEEEVRTSLKASKMPYKIGTMIELPVAALGAGQIARYAEFFSFGTNDLTQTTLGLSRDDFNSFMPDYTQFDVLDGNPFQILNDHVKELIELATRRGRLTRPDLITGLCGEHGAIPDNIRFCMEAGLNYVSCSSYSVPIAALTIAQINIERAAEKK
ncbi:MAG: pyruvate, phosphate dikinase [Spirochaetaceae bacterium]|nr:MAG: pyruvate, phosphate dikinase [Spirochaetaceae bacterium]